MLTNKVDPRTVRIRIRTIGMLIAYGTLGYFMKMGNFHSLLGENCDNSQLIVKVQGKFGIERWLKSWRSQTILLSLAVFLTKDGTYHSSCSLFIPFEWKMYNNGHQWFQLECISFTLLNQQKKLIRRWHVEGGQNSTSLFGETQKATNACG